MAMAPVTPGKKHQGLSFQKNTPYANEQEQIDDIGIGNYHQHFGAPIGLKYLNAHGLRVKLALLLINDHGLSIESGQEIIGIFGDQVDDVFTQSLACD